MKKEFKEDRRGSDSSDYYNEDGDSDEAREKPEPTASPADLKHQVEGIDAVQRALQGSFLPYICLLASKNKNKNTKVFAEPNKLVDESQGLTLLHSTSYFGNVKAMKCLVERFGADVNLADYRGQTPLHIAVLSGNLNSVVYLCENQALDSAVDIDSKDNALTTPLMNSVVTSNDHAFVYLLFKKGADPSSLDFNGQSLLHLAANSNATNIAYLLKHLYEDLQDKKSVSNYSTASKS